MSASSRLPVPPDQWISGSAAASLTGALEAMMSQRPIAETRALDRVEPEPMRTWWAQPLSGIKDGVVWIGGIRDAQIDMGSRALSAAGIDDASPDDAWSTWIELRTQALSGLAQSFSRQMRTEVLCQGGSEATAVPPAAAFLETRLTIASTTWSLVWGWTQALRDSLSEPAAETSVPNRTQDPGSSPSARSVEGSKTLDLLLEVELPVSVSFGRAEVPLKDVLKLNSGSIVELNRSVSEPVEIIVNNCVIARGEVVVVEGNYGVRIKQIISKEERLRTLH